jgi:hypothetical protein
VIKVTAGVVAIAATMASLLAQTAAAAVEPGTPVAVAPGVPDNGRAWELVTPPDPIAAQIAVAKAMTTAGDRIAYLALGPLPGAPAGSPALSTNVADRGPGGWLTTPSPTPYPESAEAFAFVAQAFNPDLTESILRTNLPREPESAQDVGLFRATASGQFQLLAALEVEDPFKGASSDLQHVLFSSAKHLLPADASRSQGRSLYEAAGTTLRLVDVAGDGSLLSDCGSTAPATNAISRDGRRIFFTAEPCGAPARAYMRTDGTTTTEISASQCDLPDCGPEARVAVAGATADGSAAFLVTGQRLTDDDSDDRSDLYRYDVASGQLTLVSAVPGATELSMTETPVVAVSEDGSRVYFQAEDPAVEGFGHLYVADAGGAHLVAGPSTESVELSADGRYAVFTTSGALTADDTDSRTDVYRYDAETGALQRISSGSVGGNGEFAATNSPRFPEILPSNPFSGMSGDGSDIIFTTAERLLPEDGNEAGDLYEWSNGRLGLVSSGRGDRNAFFLDATPDGRTVLFSTSTTLLPGDRDGGDLDFYAARIGGGFPEAAPTPCQGDSCRGAGAGQSIRALPKSAGPLAGRIILRHLGPAALRRIAATGWISLLAEVPARGRLSARARAKVGRRPELIASTSVGVEKSGPVRLRMRLSRKARRALAVGRDLGVDLVLGLAGLPQQRRIHLDLDGRR